MQYCQAVHKTIRRTTREVMVGKVGVGGANPVRIQSMTTSSTRDVAATVEQIIRLADSGCEIARVTVQGIKEADACEQIKNELIRKGYDIPLVADIHFYPPAAMRVADFVDKVRVNPGNFVDKRASFKVIEYDDQSYADELLRIEEKFTPLVEKCKRLKRAMRIGTNHGSLSDRIMNRYGDTPRGMVESALEFAHVCRKNEYHDFIFSMKSSNPQVMVLAYRLLVAEMNKLGWDYPLHLGVTEAGQGEDGRIKSAMGIGALLLDGIGDTIRVSLTEDPWYEIDPCRRLIALAEDYLQLPGSAPFIETFRQFDDIKRRQVIFSNNVPMHRDGTVIVTPHTEKLASPDIYRSLGCGIKEGRPVLSVSSADSIALTQWPHTEQGLRAVQLLQQAGVGVLSPTNTSASARLLTLSEAKMEHRQQARNEKFALKFAGEQAKPLMVKVSGDQQEEWDELLAVRPAAIALQLSYGKLHIARLFFEWMQLRNISAPVILNIVYSCSVEDLFIRASAECGALLCDGLGEGIWLEGEYDSAVLRTLSFGILQAARMRMTKTDFISCPSCGRTLFDLQDVTKKIQERTAHLPGVKIAIMGCIVNGPGEMADADFGYVGSKPGMIDLYIGKACVERDISFANAVDRLIELIKKEGRWQEPSEALAVSGAVLQ